MDKAMLEYAKAVVGAEDALWRETGRLLDFRQKCLDGLIADYALRHPDTHPGDWVLVEQRDGLTTRWWLEPKGAGDVVR